MAKNNAKKQRDILDNQHHSMSTQDSIKMMHQTEAEKEKKRLERTEKKEEKERRQKKEKMEKLVAPILLLITILVSLLVKFLGSL